MSALDGVGRLGAVISDSRFYHRKPGQNLSGLATVKEGAVAWWSDGLQLPKLLLSLPVKWFKLSSTPENLDGNLRQDSAMEFTGLDVAQYPACPTCLAENRQGHKGMKPIPMPNGVWLCLECGTEFTLDSKAPAEAVSDPKTETRILKCLPPDAFKG